MPFVVAFSLQTAARHLQRGVELLASGATEQAVAELEAAVELDPENPQARYHLGRALFTAGRPQEAVPHLEIARGSADEAGPVDFLLAQVWIEVEEFEAAGGALDAAAAARPGYPPIDFYRAELCYRLGRVERARDILRSVADAAPGWEVVRVRAGVLALEQGDNTEAASWLRAALEIKPADATIWMRLGGALAADRRPEEAVEAYRQAVQLAPDFLPARIALAVQLDNMRNHEMVAEVIDGILELDGSNPVGRYRRAMLLSLDGQLREALANVEQALAGFRAQVTAPTTAVGAQEGGTYEVLSRGLRAELLMKLERYDEAIEEASRLVDSNPWYPEGHFVLGTSLLRRGDRDGADTLRTFKQLSDARERRELADYYKDQFGDLERARAAYNEALASNPDDARSLIGLAGIERADGNLAAALELLDRANPLGPALRDWYRERILVLWALGRKEEARAVWQGARADGIRLGPEVWRRLREDTGGC